MKIYAFANNSAFNAPKVDFGAMENTVVDVLLY